MHELHSRAASRGKAPLQRQHLERYLLEHELHSRATSRGNAPPQEQHFDWRAAAWVWPWLLPGLPSCCAACGWSGDSLSATESRPIIPVATKHAASMTATNREFLIEVVSFQGFVGGAASCCLLTVLKGEPTGLFSSPDLTIEVDIDAEGDFVIPKLSLPVGSIHTVFTDASHLLP